MKKDDKIKLTDKQEAFAQHYTVHWDKKRAAIEAGYSEKTAKQKGLELSRHPRIKARIEQLRKEGESELSLNKLELFKILVGWLRSDPTQLIGLLPEEIKELPIEVRQQIQELSITTQKRKVGNDVVIVKVKFVSKEKAADMLAKHLGFYEADNDQKKTTVERAMMVFEKTDIKIANFNQP